MTDHVFIVNLKHVPTDNVGDKILSVRKSIGSAIAEVGKYIERKKAEGYKTVALETDLTKSIPYAFAIYGDKKQWLLIQVIRRRLDP